MKHTTVVNGVVSYELEPETPDDRHIIEIMKSKASVVMRQSSKGGIIFELERAAVVPETKVSVEDDLPKDLTNVERETGKSRTVKS